MTDNVVQFPTNLVAEGPEVDADEVLESCVGDYVRVVIIGIERDGSQTFTTNVDNPLELYEMMADAASSFAKNQLLRLEFHEGTEH